MRRDVDALLPAEDWEVWVFGLGRCGNILYPTVGTFQWVMIKDKLMGLWAYGLG